MKELTEQLLVTEIFGLCMHNPMSIEELTNKIYKNMYAKNLVRVYQTVEIMMKRDILIPSFRNKTIKFKIHEKITGRNNYENGRI